MSNSPATLDPHIEATDTPHQPRFAIRIAHRVNDLKITVEANTRAFYLLLTYLVRSRRPGDPAIPDFPKIASYLLSLLILVIIMSIIITFLEGSG